MNKPPKIPPEELLHEVIIRALQMTLNAWKRYLDCKKVERLEQQTKAEEPESDNKPLNVTHLQSSHQTIDAVGIDGGKASVSHRQR